MTTMKKIVLVGTLIFVPTIVYAIIAGSKHDLGQAPYSIVWGAGQGPCSACHTPHASAGAQTPLWDHQLSVAAYTTYASSGSATLNATVNAPAGISKLCLSCHDGTIALENFGGVTTGTTYVAAGANVGTDLRYDHPISFTYNPALATADGGLYNPTTQVANIPSCGGGASHIDDCMLYGAGKDQMECASCHDVHNLTGVQPFLKKDNTSSALCTTCHNK